jgi:hypothetical protein
VLRSAFLAFYWSAGIGIFLQVSALAFHWLEDCANVTPAPEENDQYNTNHFKSLSAIQAASQSTFINAVPFHL